MSCPGFDEGVACYKNRSNHETCSGFDPALGDYRDWPNPAYRVPKNTSREAARATVRASKPSIEPTTRAEDTDPAQALSGPRGAVWSERQHEIVEAAIAMLANDRAGGEQFDVDDVWTRLGATVPRLPEELATHLARSCHLRMIAPVGDDPRRGPWYSLITRLRARSF